MDLFGRKHTMSLWMGKSLLQDQNHYLDYFGTTLEIAQRLFVTRVGQIGDFSIFHHKKSKVVAYIFKGCVCLFQMCVGFFHFNLQVRQVI